MVYEGAPFGAIQTALYTQKEHYKKTIQRDNTIKQVTKTIMANTLKDIITDELIISSPRNREKWTDEEQKEFVDKLSYQLLKFFNNQLD